MLGLTWIDRPIMPLLSSSMGANIMGATGSGAEISRRSVLRTGAAGLTGACLFSPAVLRAAPTTIRFANGGAIAPNELLRIRHRLLRWYEG